MRPSRSSAAAAVFSCRTAPAASYTWTGSGGNSSWSNSANWTFSTTASAPFYPQAGDNADIPGQLANPVNVDIVASAGTLSIDNSATNLHILAGDSLNIAAALKNSGTITVLSTSSALGTLFANQTMTFSGTGDIALGPYVSVSQLPTLYISSGTLTVVAGLTVSGAGQFSNNNLLNQGLINANVPGQTLTTTVLSLMNAGTMEASNGGTLLLNVPVSNSGTILASGGTVQCPNTITGGTLATTGSPSTFLLNGSTINGVTLSAASTATVAAGATANVGSGATNYGTITVLCTSAANGTLNFVQTETLSGTGGIVLGPYINTSNEAALNITGTLTMAAGQTISGAGKFGGALLNQCLINANVPGQTLTQNSSMANAGVWRPAIVGPCSSMPPSATQARFWPPAGRCSLPASACLPAAR